MTATGVTRTMKIEVDALLPRIEAALLDHDISKTKFGYLVAGDPALVTKMKRGRVLREGPLKAKIEAALARLEKDGKL